MAALSWPNRKTGSSGIPQLTVTGSPSSAPEIGFDQLSATDYASPEVDYPPAAGLRLLGIEVTLPLSSTLSATAGIFGRAAAGNNQGWDLYYEDVSGGRILFRGLTSAGTQSPIRQIPLTSAGKYWIFAHIDPRTPGSGGITSSLSHIPSGSRTPIVSGTLSAPNFSIDETQPHNIGALDHSSTGYYGDEITVHQIALWDFGDADTSATIRADISDGTDFYQSQLIWHYTGYETPAESAVGRSTNNVQAFLLHDRRIATDKISASDSSYTEAGPRPGPALASSDCSRIRPAVHAAQSADLSIGVVRGGQPGPDTCGLVYRETSEPVTDYRSWNPPWILRDCEIIDYDDGTISSEDWAYKVIAVIPDSQRLVLACRDVGGAVRTWTWDPSDRSWTDNGAVAFPGGSGAGLSIVYVPDLCGLLLMGDANSGKYGSVMYSDDDGATWSEYATDILDVAVDSSLGVTAGSSVVDRYGNIYTVRSASGQLQTWVSSDGGATFQQVENTTSIDTDWTDVTTNVNGDIVVAYVDGTSLDITVAILRDGYDTIVGAPSVTISETASDCTVFTDADGTIYVAVAGTSDGSVRMYRSTDGGESFAASQRLYQPEVAAAYPDDFVARMSAGQMIFATTFQHPTTTTQEGTLLVMYGGGWDSVEADASSGSSQATPEGRLGWALTAGLGYTWPAFSELPSNLGFTSTGTAATLSADGWHMSTAASFGQYSETWTHSSNRASVLAIFRVTTGVNQTATYSGFQVQRQNGSAQTTLHINADTTGFDVYDNEASTSLGTATIDMTDFVHVMIVYDDTIDSATVWYRSHTSDTWEGGTTFSLSSSATAGTTNLLRWGHINSGTAVSDWRLLARCDGKYVRHKLTDSTAYDGFRWGRGLDASPYPLRDQGDASYRTRLSVSGGPARRGDVFTVSARHDYAIDNLDPLISPSPKRPWRSTQVASAESIVWDMGADTLFHSGAFLGLMLQGEHTPRTATLEVKQDGGAYSTIGTYDGATDFFEIEYTLLGDVIVPRIGDPAGRFLRDGEAAGGYVILDPNVNPKARGIVDNKGGWWQGSSGAEPHFRLTGIDGSEKLVGVCTVVMPRGLMLVPIETTTAFRYIKVSFPVQDLPDGYFTTGVAVVGGVLVPGRGMSRGWSMRWTPNVSSREDAYGTVHNRQVGPVRREFTWSYQDITSTKGLYNDFTDYHIPLKAGSDDYVPAVDRSDLIDKIAGMLLETKGGELPVVGLLDLPSDIDGSVTITDPRAFIYGTLAGSVQMNQVIGVQGDGEGYRVESLTIIEQPWSID